MHNPHFASLTAGLPYPLGATVGTSRTKTATSVTVNFALVAPNASSVELCLYDETATIELQRLTMPACENGVWHGQLQCNENAPASLIYGYRVAGIYAPEKGHRFNPAKLVLDPYAREIVGAYDGRDAFCGENAVDTGAFALKAKIDLRQLAPYDWENDQPPLIPSHKTVLYELHVQGFTKLLTEVPLAQRGTYAGLASDAALNYLTRLGITAVSLLPVHFRADEARLQKSGLSNYWGYSSIGFFAPESRYWSQAQASSVVSEFRDMVKALHARNIEVILDVVYNHTGETDEYGPTLSFRGIDNALYYRLKPDQLASYENWTGCGNTLNIAEPRVLQLVMDSLRYWVQDMHVDGFRFDLAPILGRTAQAFSARAAFFQAIIQDPVLTRVKLIAEPWDIGPEGYQLGNFPDGWLEWNDQYRDSVRAFWLGHGITVGQFAHSFAGSSNLFKHDGRLPSSSVNFITAHDGFTLNDLVSYAQKHNEQNGEQNRDGSSENLSMNCGVEGPTTDEAIQAQRKKLSRALITTLLLSQGTPMLLAGDEFGNSQGGNNNAYCQANEIGWLNWPGKADHYVDLISTVLTIKKQYPLLNHDQWFKNDSNDPAAPILTWLNRSGQPMTQAQWQGQNLLTAYFQDNVVKHQCLVLFNAGPTPEVFGLPNGDWQFIFNSSNAIIDQSTPLATSCAVPAHCVMVAASVAASAATTHAR